MVYAPPHTPLILGVADSHPKLRGWSVRNPLFYNVFWGPPKFKGRDVTPLNLGCMGWQGNSGWSGGTPDKLLVGLGWYSSCRQCLLFLVGLSAPKLQIAVEAIFLRKRSKSLGTSAERAWFLLGISRIISQSLAKEIRTFKSQRFFV